MTKQLVLSPHAAPKSDLNKTKQTKPKPKPKQIFPITMNKEVKTFNPITDNDAFASIASDPNLMYTPWRSKNLTENYINLLAVSLVDFFLNHPKRALRIEQFLLVHNISRSQLDKWAIQYPQIAEAKERVFNIIAARRDIGGMEGKYNPMMVKYTLPVYDDLQRQENDRQTTLKLTPPNHGVQRALLVEYIKDEE